MNIVHDLGALLVLALVIGGAIQILKNPDAANSLATAGASSFIGVTHALEGRASAP